MSEFIRNKHVFSSKQLPKIIKEGVEFFNRTPVYNLPSVKKFDGTGVYGLYYNGNYKYYKNESSDNRNEIKMPIYIGKAVPQGWRQSRINVDELKKSYELFRRLSEHSKSIGSSGNLQIDSFYCRFVVFEGESVDLISTIESALIRHHKPLWNTTIDGFGNHDPGSGRYNQAKSDWDVLHPGRLWADKCKGKPNALDHIKHNISKHYELMGPSNE